MKAPASSLSPLCPVRAVYIALVLLIDNHVPRDDPYPIRMACHELIGRNDDVFVGIERAFMTSLLKVTISLRVQNSVGSENLSLSSCYQASEVSWNNQQDPAFLFRPLGQ